MSSQAVTADDAQHPWLDDLFAAIDEMNVERFLRFLTPDATFRFGSAAPAKGENEIREAVEAFFASISGCRHVLGNILADDGTLVCEGEVTYTRHDGSKITLPFANVFELDGELVSHYKIYADAAPLYAE